jgi:hypothetical protein
MRRQKRYGREGLTPSRPVAPTTAPTQNEVFEGEEATKRTGADRVHGAGLEINENGTGDILAGTNLVVIDGDALELEVVAAVVDTIMPDTVFI